MILRVTFDIDVARCAIVANEQLCAAVAAAIEELTVTNLAGKKLPNDDVVLGKPFAFEAEVSDD